MKVSAPIEPCLWFDGRCEEAAEFYVSIFDNSKVGKISRFSSEGQDLHGQQAGAVMAVAFTLNGQPFLALNGGPMFKFTEAISFQVFCDTQEQIDYFWDRLLEGGGVESQCGWLKDRFGVSWQVSPATLPAMMTDGTPEQAARVTAAFLPMRKLDMAAIEKAYRG